MADEPKRGPSDAARDSRGKMAERRPDRDHAALREHAAARSKNDTARPSEPIDHDEAFGG